MNAWSTDRRRGFTLIEVMIAIGIMTVGSLGILSMHHAVSGANRAAHEMNTALAIGRNRSRPACRIASSCGTPAFRNRFT